MEINPSTLAGTTPGGTDAAATEGHATLPTALAGASVSSIRQRRELGGTGWRFRKLAHPPQPHAAQVGQVGQVGQVVEDPWLPATVPGCVHTDLLANGKIGDPFYRLNEKDQQWIERESWEYRTTFALTPADLTYEHVELDFAGLDTYADVFVNGAAVLSANNMFRSWRVDVRPHLVTGANVVLVRFHSPILQVKPAYDHLGYRLPAANDQAEEMVSMFSRKAPFHFGWDWAPRFVTSGIWRPVALELWNQARLDDVQVFQQHLGADLAELTVEARVEATHAFRAQVTVTLAGARAGEMGGAVLATETANLVSGPNNELTIRVRIPHPELWWPNGLGAQRLYTLETTLSDPATHTIRDQRRTRIGLRTVEVVHQRDAAGKSFFIRVNGAPVFMKGANWIPADSFVTRVGGDRYRFLLESAVAANMNMVRVWGGGIYEDDRFYELCDELGLLVWQDFMFACSMYPGDPAFVENVRHEAVDNIRRLRNHPSLALWAGNNENEAAWRNWGWPAKFHLSKKVQDTLSADYQKMFHQVLPAIVAREDPGRFYSRSSPSANEDGVPANRLGWGDMHYWGVWHAESPYAAYSDNISRFMSEYGFQSFPALSSVARYTARATDWDIDSAVMQAHQRHPRGNALIRTYLERDFRAPKDFASFLYVQQVLQGIVIKYAAEAHRRAMGDGRRNDGAGNWGSLYWQLDDCWPVASWSGIDYYGRWKALHYFARRFFAPVLVSPIEEKGRIDVWAISDRRTDTPARLTVRLIDFAGRELLRREQSVILTANASRLYLSLDRRDALAGADPAKVVLVAELSENRRLLSRNTLSFVKTKELALPQPDLTLGVEPRADGSFTIQVTARKYARNVYLTAEHPSQAGFEHGLGNGLEDGFFEDNFFDVLPGETVATVFRPRSHTTAVDLRAALRATSIAESYDNH